MRQLATKTAISSLKLMVIVMVLGMAQAAFAQSNPTVEIVLSSPTAKVGDTINADVYIRNATNIGGADIGIKVDDTCLRIVNRQPGPFLPSDGAQGGFSPFSELHDHDTRFAASITDRSKLGNGDGLFFTAQLQVICENGVAPLTVVFAEFSAYKDPTAAQIELVAYRLTDKTVNAINTQLTIGNPQAVTPNPAATVNTTPIAGATAQSGVATPVSAGTAQPTAAPAQSSPILPIVVIVLTVIGVGILGGAFFLLRGRPAGETVEEEIEEDE